VSDISIATLDDWLHAYADLIAEHQAELTELDSVIGDADHGGNMARGFAAVVAKLDAGAPATVDELFKSVGMTLVSTVGGASGPLYGTFFLRFGMTAGAVDALDVAGMGAALRAGLDGIAARGKAELGDKTMVDALTPAVEAWEKDAAAGDEPQQAAADALDAARAGRDATIPLVARKGRASYLGERSAGHMDPGATSSALLFEALASTLEAAAASETED
jgi:phosphoenolpyruvate---glycerone phosphotransferase subunit DhaL